MKVIAFVHMYPPHHNAGAEHYLHALLTYLAGRGISCEVIGRDIQSNYIYEGVRCFTRRDKDRIKWADLVITHLDMTGEAVNLCRKHKLPLMHLIHNSYHNHYIELSIMPRPVYAVYNSQWIADKMPYPVESLVLRPPVYAEKYATKPGDKITLINVNENKGGFELVWLAEMLPQYQFLGVLGSYDSNGYTGQIKKDLPNLTYIPNTPNIKEVYGMTKVLIMPSKYESYGRTAIEAGLSGIPVLHNETPGLREALHGSGVSVPQRDAMVTDMAKFAAELERLMDEPEWYAFKSRQIREHCEGLQAQQEAELNAVYDLIVKHEQKEQPIKDDTLMKAIADKEFAARKDPRTYMRGEEFEETESYIKDLERLGFAHRIDPQLEFDRKQAEEAYQNKAVMPETKRKGRPKKNAD